MDQEFNSRPVFPQSAMAELTAVIVRSVPMASGEFNPFGAGLASDGTHLFVANGTNGTIQEYDLETLQLNRTIQTSITRVRGLEYRDGINFAYASQIYRDDVTGSPSTNLSPFSSKRRNYLVL